MSPKIQVSCPLHVILVQGPCESLYHSNFTLCAAKVSTQYLFLIVPVIISFTFCYSQIKLCDITVPPDIHLLSLTPHICMLTPSISQCFFFLSDFLSPINFFFIFQLIVQFFILNSHATVLFGN